MIAIKKREVKSASGQQPDGELQEEVITRDDFPFISPRLAGLFLLFAATMILFTTRIYKLTILEGPRFEDLSKNNFMIPSYLLAPRGRILDRFGNPLAVNQTLYDLEMSPFHMEKQEIRTTIDRLAKLLNKPELREKADDVVKLKPAWKSISLVRNLKLPEVLPVMEQSFQLPGVIPTARFQRYYPNGALTGNATGHVGKISDKNKEDFIKKGYLPTEMVGQLGAEYTFEELLHGEVGLEYVTRDAHGRPRDRQVARPAKPGNTVTLTLDLGLQRLAEALMSGWEGAIVVMDPRDGAVLAMVGNPTYDPNFPTKGNSFNKITMSTFAPGSTYKVVTAAAGLQLGLKSDYIASCDGRYEAFGTSFPCHIIKYGYGHGSMDLYKALRDSCNVFFYQWAQKAGKENMIEMAHAFGFGRKTGFELVAPHQEKAGKPEGSEQSYAGSLLQMGIGQGNLIDVTPIQMVRAYAALANGGILYRPRIIKEVRSPDGKLIKEGQAEEQGRLPLTTAQIDEIRKGLWDVVHDYPKGTGSKAKIKSEWRVAGKTGTAQHGRKGIPSNAWFCCYSPMDPNEPAEIVIMILVEHAGHGGEIAAPMARQLMAYYYGEPEPDIVPPPHDEEPPKEEEE